MVNLVLLYSAITWMAQTRGYKSPLYGGFGLVVYFLIANVLMAFTDGFSEFAIGLVSDGITLAGFAGLLWTLPKKDARSAPKTSWAPFTLLGFASIGLSGLFAWFWFSTMKTGRSDTTSLIMAGLCLTASISCFRYRGQRTLPDVATVLAGDHRPPVLFLRSFSSKACRKKSKLRFLPMYPADFGESFEEFLTPSAKRLGPFIALGDPDDYLPSFGAAKIYRRDDSWQATVLHFLSQSACVLILEGATPGLKWELSQVRARCSPSKVFLLTPSRPFPRLDWDGFARLLQTAGFDVPPDPGAGALIGFDGWFRPIIIGKELGHADQVFSAMRAWNQATGPIATQQGQPQSQAER